MAYINMKKSTIITALTAIMMMAVTPAFAQEENGFKKFNVREDFTENGFQWFHDAELLAAGDKEKSNVMTIGWGGIGTLWGRTALTVKSPRNATPRSLWIRQNTLP